MLRIQLLFSTIALFVGIELLCGSIRRLPPNRGNRGAVFEGSPLFDTTWVNYYIFMFFYVFRRVVVVVVVLRPR